MAINKTDFSEFTTGVKPTGWNTSVNGNRNTGPTDSVWIVTDLAEAAGGKVLRFSPGGTNNYSIIWPDVTVSEHQRAQFRWRPFGQSGSDLRSLHRATDVIADNISGYTLGVRSADLDINKYDVGAFSNFANDTTGYTAQDGTWYITETEVVGINPTVMRVKTYPEGGTEPATWEELGGGPDGAINDSDATDIEAGGFGFFALVGNTVDVDWIVVTTAGEEPTFDDTVPTITDINTTNEVTPGASATLTGTNLTNTTQVTVGGEIQEELTVVSDTEVTFRVRRGGNPYNQDLTAELTSTDGTATITVQQIPEAGTFAVTAASPNTIDDASLWAGLVDTITGDPITIVDGDQAWVENYGDSVSNLAIAPDGTITADETGTFTVQIWLASEGEWGGDQTVSFTLPDAALLPKGTMPILRFLADQGITKGTINERLIKFFQSQGATSRQFNHAQRQYEATL